MCAIHLYFVFICTYEQGLSENGDVKVDRNAANFIQCDFCAFEFFFLPPFGTQHLITVSTKVVGKTHHGFWVLFLWELIKERY